MASKGKKREQNDFNDWVSKISSVYILYIYYINCHARIGSGDMFLLLLFAQAECCDKFAL